MNKKQTSVLIALATIAMNNKNGFTVNAANLQPVTTGYAVALKRTQNSFGAEGLAKVANVIEEIQATGEMNGRTLAFGGWYDSESGLYYYDATVIFTNRAEAIEAGRANEQIAIFDLANLEEIRL